MQQETNQKRLAALPVKYTSYKKGRQGGAENNGETIETKRDAEGASPHEKTEHIHEVENRESEQSIQMCKSSNEKKQDDTHTHKIHLASCLHWI